MIMKTLAPTLCRSPVPPLGDACPSLATYRLTFRDGDVMEACQKCALNLQQVALGAVVKVERLVAQE
jgi:hypothetical protein